MARSHLERMKAIDDYFASITSEELEQKLIDAGAGRITSCQESGFRLEANCYNCSNGMYVFDAYENEFAVGNSNNKLGEVA